MSLSKIYLNNFRGFYNTEIAIADVNFLVGENSSGKTSILKLVELLSSHEFWLNGAFRKPDIDFGFFGDIHTETNNETDVTSLGVIFGSDNKKSQTSVLFLIDQTDDHQARISGLKFNKDLEDFHVSFGKKGKDVSYKVVPTKKTTIKNFSKWCKEGIDTDNLIGLTKGDDFVYMQEAPYFTITQIYRKSTKNGKNKRSSEILQFDEVLNGYKWIAPIRIKPQKTYDDNVFDYSSDGAHVPYLLKKYLEHLGARNQVKLFLRLTNLAKKVTYLMRSQSKILGLKEIHPLLLNLF